MILIISGPAGTGKTTQERLIIERLRFKKSVSATTRKPRPGEIDGLHYHFISPAEFQSRINSGEFAEWAKVHGNLYGTLAKDLLAACNSGQNLILTVDVVGHGSIMNYPNDDLKKSAVGIFLNPPNMNVLEQRLRNRNDGTSEEEISRRMQAARLEIDSRHSYDHIITTYDQENTFTQIVAIIEDHS